MAFNLSVEDCSPLISYSPPGAWTDATNDTLLSDYSDSSYHVSSVQGSQATIKFNGTGIMIYGAKRPDYGSYEITLDGQSIVNGSSTGEDLFQQVLGSASGLSSSVEHKAVLTSTSSSPIDIDFVEVQTQIGQPGSQLSHYVIDDSNSTFVYSQSAWQTNNEDYFLYNTLHFTSDAGASASVAFSGEAVALYGTVSPDHADIQLTLDGQNITFPAGANTTSTLHTKVLLYWAQGLEPNMHNLTVSADPLSSVNSQQFIDVDAVYVYSTSPGNQTDTSAQSNAAPSPKLPTKDIVGIIVGTLVGILVFYGLIFFLLRSRYRRMQPTEDKEKAPSPATTQNSVEKAAPNGSSGGAKRTVSVASSFYTDPPRESVGSFSSMAPIIPNAVPAIAYSTDQADSVDMAPARRPPQRPPPLDLPISY